MLTTPLISVITPVGPRHRKHVSVARASVAWQTLPAAWVEHLVAHDTDRSGPAAVRNRLIAQARGTFVVCLDADDYLIPTALETYVRGMAAAATASYVYADNYVINQDGWHYSNSAEYHQANQARWNAHVVTCLLPTALVRDVGGFDEAIDIWEDWTLFLKLAMRGYCGHRLAQPALVYRLTEGERMQAGMVGGKPLMEAVWRRYANEQGQIVMCGCNKPAAAAQAQQQAQLAVQVLGAPAGGPDNGLIRLEYQGPQRGGFFVTSQATGQQYRLGGRRIVDASPADVEWLTSLGCVPVVRAEFVPPPEPGTVAAGSDAESTSPAQPAPQPLAELAPGPEAPVEGVPFEPKRMRRRKAAGEEAA